MIEIYILIYAVITITAMITTHEFLILRFKDHHPMSSTLLGVFQNFIPLWNLALIIISLVKLDETKKTNRQIEILESMDDVYKAYENSIQSRTCEGCKYFLKEWQCKNEELNNFRPIMDADYWLHVPHDFYCNKWEKKDD